MLGAVVRPDLPTPHVCTCAPPGIRKPWVATPNWIAIASHSPPPVSFFSFFLFFLPLFLLMKEWMDPKWSRCSSRALMKADRISPVSQLVPVIDGSREDSNFQTRHRFQISSTISPRDFRWTVDLPNGWVIGTRQRIWGNHYALLTNSFSMCS